MKAGVGLLTRALVCAFALTAASAALAAWPDDQPVKIIVPQAAGGTNDTVARLVGVELGKALKQVVLVENRPGASGAIGMQAVVQARADGYTLGLASDSAALLNVIQPKLTWQFKRDVRGIGMIGEQPIALFAKRAHVDRAWLPADCARAVGWPGGCRSHAGAGCQTHV